MRWIMGSNSRFAFGIIMLSSESGRKYIYGKRSSEFQVWMIRRPTIEKRRTNDERIHGVCDASQVGVGGAKGTNVKKARPIAGAT
jgi:hypothetical protein